MRIFLLITFCALFANAIQLNIKVNDSDLAKLKKEGEKYVLTPNKDDILSVHFLDKKNELLFAVLYADGDVYYYLTTKTTDDDLITERLGETKGVPFNIRQYMRDNVTIINKPDGISFQYGYNSCWSRMKAWFFCFLNCFNRDNLETRLKKHLQRQNPEMFNIAYKYNIENDKLKIVQQ
jgi:hypothetical protein